ncbi:MAG: TonB-dependent receptor [Armatimonadota bacterium]|nr:MAG: TonB-dependent receptor [Armatimonadota bacterium]
MNRLLKAVVALGLAVSLASVAWASEEGDEEPVFEVEVIGQAAQRPPGSAATSTSVITETEIERSGAQNLMDLLVREPGVWVSRQGGMGFGGNVSIRGFGGSPPTQLAVLLDGHPTQMGIMGHILPTSYVLENARSIQVLRGPAGAMYGDMAIGGVINIVTRGPRDEESTGAVSATGGSFDAAGGQAWFRGLNEQWGYRAQLGSFNTDGDNPFAKYHGDNYSLAIDHSLRGGWETTLRGQRLVYTTFDQREVANAYAEERPAEFIEQDYDRQDYDLTFSRSEAHHTTEIKLYRTQGEHEFQDGFHSEDFGQGILVSQIVPIRSGRGRWSIAWKSLGGDVYSMAQSFSRDERAAHVMLEQPLARQTEVSAGLRYATPDDLDEELLPHLGLAHELPNRWTLFTSARRGYRAPSFRELFLFGINNPNLQPESAWQYEVGGRRRWSSGAQVELSLFRIRADDLIVLRPRPAGVPGLPVQYANAQDVTRNGFEVGARWPAGLDTACYANFSHLNPGEVKEQTVGRKLAAGVDRRSGRWLLSGDIEYIDRLFDYDQTSTLVQVPAFTVVNLKASRSLAYGAKLGLVIENLFDRTYRVDPAYPYPMSGRAVRLQLEKSW